MGLFDKNKEIEAIQIYFDKYNGVKDEMNNINITLNKLGCEMQHTRNVLLIVITLFGIFTPLLFHLHSEKFDAKIESVNTRINGIEQRIDKMEQRMDKMENKLDIIIKKLK